MKSTTKKAHGWHCQESPPTDTYMILTSRTMEKSRGGCARLIFVMSKFLQSIKKKKKKHIAQEQASFHLTKVHI